MPTHKASTWISVGLAAGRVIRRLQLSPGPSGAATRGAGPSPQAQGGAAGGGLDKSPDGEQHARAPPSGSYPLGEDDAGPGRSRGRRQRSGVQGP
jgi:hypothetical protein